MELWGSTHLEQIQEVLCVLNQRGQVCRLKIGQ